MMCSLIMCLYLVLMCVLFLVGMVFGMVWIGD